MTRPPGFPFRDASVGLGAIWVLLFVFSGPVTVAQTNTNVASRPSPVTNVNSSRSEQIRSECVQGRRYICGKVVQIVPDGLVIDSGYADLLKSPLNKSWVVPGTASLTRNPASIEENKPDAICIGLVFLTVFPKKPKVNEYDYVALHVYPCGQYQYKPVPGVEKTIRRYSGSLERAVQLNLEAEAASKK